MSGTDADDEGSSDEPENGRFDDPADRFPGEPEEFDPDSLGPDVPEPPDPVGTADPEAASTFWKLVVVFDVAIFALSLGPMFVFFRGQVELGLQIFAVGLFAFGYGVVRYQRFRVEDNEGSEHNG